MLALAACKESVGVLDPVEPTIPDSEKTPIELSVGGVDSPNPITRAVAPVITNEDKTYKPFDKDTKIFMVMKSTYGQEDYQGSKKDKYTVSRGDVTANSDKIVFDDLNQKYWDDAHARSSQLDIWAYAAMVPSTWNSCTFQVPSLDWSPISPETPEHLIQEYSGKTYETATQAADKSPYPWIEQGDKGSKGAIYPCIMEWKVTNENTWKQTTNSIQYQDLMFSNNLTKHGDDPAVDNRLKFNFSTRKFDGGEMKFYHAMSKITINIIEGDGFDKTSANKDKDFQFANGTNIKFPQDVFNTQGTFNIKNGYFEKVDNRNEITSIALTTPKGEDPNPYYTLQALAIPNINGINDQTDLYSRFVQDDTKVVMEFTIDNSTYKITSGDLYLALHGKDGATETTTGIIPLEAGKNYVFTFKVGKTKIKDITAQLADWESVTAEDMYPSNARIKLNLEERGTTLTSSDEFSLYRAAYDNTGEINDNYTNYKWQTGYKGNGNVTTPTYVDENGSVPAHWTTNWYWDNNKNFYHFRVLAKINGTQKEAYTPTINTETQSEVDYDYITLSHKEKSYDDILWGAPMLDKEKNQTPDNTGDKPLLWLYGPTENGFDADDDGKVSAGLPTETQHQIYKAIGPTEDQIKLILFHMMSDVTFKIYTSSGVDKVNLGTGSGTDVTTIELKNIHKEGKLYMGNGLVKGSDAVSDFTFTQPPALDASGYLKWAGYGAIPQDLANVQLVITTPDHNKYIVDLAEVVTTGITSKNLANPYEVIPEGEKNAGKYQLNRWYPGFKYNYTFKLTKKGITDIQATIVPWGTVEAEQEVQIR